MLDNRAVDATLRDVTDDYPVMTSRRLAVTAASFACIASLAACGGSDVPEYTVEQDPNKGAGAAAFDVFVAFDDPADLEAVFNDVIDDQAGKHGEGVYWVDIHCDGDPNANLATGKYAEGSRGAIQTGLDEGEREFNLVDGATCDPDATPAESDCSGTVRIDEQLQPFTESVKLPGGQVVAARVSKDSDHPGMIAVAFDLCGVPIDSEDQLRPIATQFAQAVHADPLGQQVFAMYITNYTTYTPDDLVTGQKVKVGDFQIFNWRSDVAVSPDSNWDPCPSGTCPPS